MMDFLFTCAPLCFSLSKIKQFSRWSLQFLLAYPLRRILLAETYMFSLKVLKSVMKETQMTVLSLNGLIRFMSCFLNGNAGCLRREAREGKVLPIVKIVTFALLLLSQSLFAADLPSAGSQFQQIPPSPARNKAVPQIRIEQGLVPAIPAADQIKVLVKSLHLIGQTLYPEAELVVVSGFHPGEEQTLADLRLLAGKITDHYRRHGYFVAQAYLPAQEINDGTVTIKIVEGHYGRIILNNQADLANDVAITLLDGLNNGAVIATAPLERALLLLSDLPGVAVKSTLIPGGAAGISDLLVDITPGPSITGSVDFDNAGNRYTGEYRLGATVNFNEPLGYGDVATLRALTSGFGLFYLRGSYELQAGEARIGAAYSFLEYRLVKEFETLHANGTAHIASLYGSYPLIRSRRNNLYAGLAVYAKSFEDRLDLTATVTKKEAQALVAGMYGDCSDHFGGGGLNSYSLTLTSGNLDIKTPEARTLDAATARSNGLYNKLGFSAMRLQRVIETISLYAAINGQFAFNNLDVSEKMELGGMYAVRAYPEGEAYADQGYILTLEVRKDLPKLIERLPGQVQLVGFVDSGSVTVNNDPWTAESNSRTLSGAGAGLIWMEENNFSLKTYYAVKLGNEAPTSAPDEFGRFWIQIIKYF